MGGISESVTEDASFVMTAALGSSETRADSAASVSGTVALWDELSAVELGSEASTAAHSAFDTVDD